MNNKKTVNSEIMFEEVSLSEIEVLTESNTPLIIGGVVCGFAICAGAACGGGCGGALCGF